MAIATHMVQVRIPGQRWVHLEAHYSEPTQEHLDELERNTPHLEFRSIPLGLRKAA